MQEVGLPADHVDGFIRFGLAQLPEHGFLDVAGDLRLAPSIVLAGQADLQAGRSQEGSHGARSCCLRCAPCGECPG